MFSSRCSAERFHSLCGYFRHRLGILLMDSHSKSRTSGYVFWRDALRNLSLVEVRHPRPPKVWSDLA